MIQDMTEDVARKVDDLLHRLKGRTLLVPGSRNNDTVNVCILDWCENGYTDDDDAFVDRALGTLKKFDYDGSELDYFEDKAYTVHVYLTGWGPKGDELAALDYII